MERVRGLLLAGSLLAAPTLSVFRSETRAVVLPGGGTAATEVGVWIHNDIPVTARAKVRRDGSDNSFAQRLIRVQLVSPTGATKSAIQSIGASEATLEVNLPAAGGSNTVKSWKVSLVNLEPSANPEVSQDQASARNAHFGRALGPHYTGGVLC